MTRLNLIVPLLVAFAALAATGCQPRAAKTSLQGMTLPGACSEGFPSLTLRGDVQTSGVAKLIVKYTLFIDSQISLNMDPKTGSLRLELHNDLQTEKTIANRFRDQVNSSAQASVESSNGGRTLFPIAPEEVRAASRSLDWTVPACGLVFLRSLTVQRGTESTDVAFSPALPFIPDTRLGPSKLASIIGSGLPYRGITATVTSTSDPMLEVGMKVSINTNFSLNSERGIFSSQTQVTDPTSNDPMGHLIFSQLGIFESTEFQLDPTKPAGLSQVKMPIAMSDTELNEVVYQNRPAQ